MDSRNVLSRRTLLKASSFLAVAAAVAPVAAVAAPAVSEVLTTLLTEYAAAADASKASHAQVEAARRAKSDAVDKANLYFMWPDGTYGRIGDSGNTYHPEYALSWLEREIPKYRALCASRSDNIAEMKKRIARTKRQIKALGRRYEAIVAASDWRAALDADTKAYHRFLAARNAVKAYRPVTLAEVAALIRCISDVGTYAGFNGGLSVSDLANMLDATEAA